MSGKIRGGFILRKVPSIGLESAYYKCNIGHLCIVGPKVRKPFLCEKCSQEKNVLQELVMEYLDKQTIEYTLARYTYAIYIERYNIGIICYPSNKSSLFVDMCRAYADYVLDFCSTGTYMILLSCGDELYLEDIIPNEIEKCIKLHSDKTLPDYYIDCPYSVLVC